MSTRNNIIHGYPATASNSLLVSGDFTCRTRIAGNNQGRLQMTVTAREWTTGQYFVRIIMSLMPGTFLYSQDQPENMRQLATRIEFHKNGGFIPKEKAIEVGKHFIHSDGAYGLRPTHGDKITFIQHLERQNQMCDISGAISYRAFKEDVILDECVEEFRIRLNQ